MQLQKKELFPESNGDRGGQDLLLAMSVQSQFGVSDNIKMNKYKFISSNFLGDALKS